jgi:hypothetical protein
MTTARPRANRSTSATATTAMSNVATSVAFERLVRATVFHRWVQVAAMMWILAHLLVLLLARGQLPFDRPALAALPFARQLAAPTVQLIEVFVLMSLVSGLTRTRIVPDLAARAPERNLTRHETLMVLAYAAMAQAGGWVCGSALGYRPFSFHIAGTLYDHTIPPTPGEMVTWASYNFVAFAAAPYWWFRRLYSDEQLSLHSSNLRNDIQVIGVVLVVETLFQLWALPAIARASLGQLLIAAPISFIVYALGTVLPTMILIHAILVPRYLSLTGNVTTTVLLSGVTYAAMHLVEGWSSFATVGDTVLSLLFVLFTYLGAGMFKAFVTLQTGNAWVHAIGYHAVAPHVVVDAPLILRVLGIR